VQAVCDAAKELLVVGLKYDADNVNSLVFQWQDGKQLTVWPEKIAEGSLKYPSFIKISQ
jgi:branched-chain amino acid transport system substrate-binding protein